MAVKHQDGEKQIVSQVSIDPINFIGVQWTTALSEGDYAAYLGNFPKPLFAEFHPLRFRYPAVAYGEHSGKEYPAQAIYTGYAECALRMALIVEGHPDEPVVAAFATTRLNRVFNLYGEEISVKTPEKLASDPGYRKDVVLSGGTSVKKLKGMPVTGERGLQAVFDTWGIARVKGLPDQRTPLPETLARRVARENPEYSFVEKCVDNCKLGLPIPPTLFSVVVSVLADIYTAASAPDKGWDEKSELSRGNQGLIAQVIDAQYQAAKDAGMTCNGSSRRVTY
ncbi:MAG: hypothetical protein A2878_00155 [Candidatus Moranbacteria bacterium RIFCSPHIGHO2_01_FULL_54_31]|nr:MAG: hypothetical protein A2878_00155 [Candidatus Moranbacteria bacterium RIFCSPHIGHO2_01_FULL_54_31]